MKRHGIVMILGIAMFSGLISCKKYTCECSAHNLSIPEPGGQTTYSVKKKDKARMCADKSTQPDSFGNYTTCVIK